MADANLFNNEALDVWAITDHARPFKEADAVKVLQTRRDYAITNRLFAGKRPETAVGTDLEFDVLLEDSSLAEWTQPDAEATLKIPNLVLKGRVPWRYLETKYAVLQQEVLMNRDAAKQYDLLIRRRTPALFAMATKIEVGAAQTPANANDLVSCYGFPYYNVPITSAQVSAGTSGHQGRNPLYQDGNSIGNCAGIDSSEGARGEHYVNYNDVWTNASGDITEADVDKLLMMNACTHFNGPLTAKDVEDGVYDKMMFLSNLLIWTAVNRKARANNDSLGADIGRYAGQTRIQGNAIIPWDSLETSHGYTATTNPLLAINAYELRPIVLKGDFFRFDGPRSPTKQHNMLATFINLTCNFACRGRREQGRIDWVA